jgi:hypothetical protein
VSTHLLPKVPRAFRGTFGGVDIGQTVGSVGTGKKITYITLLLSQSFVSLDSGKQGMIKECRACHDPKRKH